MKIVARISVFVLLLFVALFSGVALAEEKSASCPAKFDPDDSAWVLSFIDPNVTDFYVEYGRLLDYFPYSEKSIFVGLKKLQNLDCFARLYSYGSLTNGFEKRVWGVIESPAGDVYYFWVPDMSQEKGYQIARGDDVRSSFRCSTAKKCYLSFTLYNKGMPITVREVEIK